MESRRQPDPKSRLCKLANKRIIIVQNRKIGSDYCSTGQMCTHEECRYKSGTIDPFGK